MKRLKMIVGWGVIAALVIFALMNFQQAKISLFNVSLSAPLSYIIALAALFGAFAGHAIVTAIRWAVRETMPRKVRHPQAKPTPAAAGDEPADAEPSNAEPSNAQATDDEPADDEPADDQPADESVDDEPAEAEAIVAPTIAVRGAGHTAPGRERNKNEDSMVVDNDLGLFIACDGMGGHAAGEVASTMAATAVARSLRRAAPAINRVRRGRDEPAALQPIIADAVRTASAAVLEAAERRREWRGMGCALTLLLVADDDRAVFGHVGDTRLYRWRDHEVEQLTRDHSMAAELVDGGVLSEQQAHDSPMAHALTRCVGHSPDVDVDTRVVDMRAGDIFVLCSDGLADYLEKPDQLNRIIEESAELLPGRLVAFANKSGGHDNITAVAVTVGD